MKKFTYWSNATTWHEKELFSVFAETILEADVAFQKATGLNPIKSPWVAVTIRFRLKDK